MAKSQGQKLKLLYLMDILLKRTDEDHALTANELIAALEEQGIGAERKSLYDDLELLRRYGLDIETKRGRGYAYYVASREFELPELKLLVDAIQSARFISGKKSRELIAKLEGLTSVHEARQLQRQVYVDRRVKTVNESVYYAVDALHNAVSQGKKVTFRYFEWALDFSAPEKLGRRYRREGAAYTVSPWTLMWDSENYYMVAYDDLYGEMRHYRVDRMTDIALLPEPRAGREAFEALDTGTYAKRVFAMFAGEEETVSIRFADRLIGVVVDRFGTDVFLVPDGEAGFFRVTVRVAVSEQFLAWIFSFGHEAKILSPDHVARTLQTRAREVLALY